MSTVKLAELHSILVLAQILKMASSLVAQKKDNYILFSYYHILTYSYKLFIQMNDMPFSTYDITNTESFNQRYVVNQYVQRSKKFAFANLMGKIY